MAMDGATDRVMDGAMERMGETMYKLAAEQPGCFGAESTRDADGVGITVSYWKDEECIRLWKAQAQHLFTQKKDMEQWYDHYDYELRVAKV